MCVAHVEWVLSSSPLPSLPYPPPPFSPLPYLSPPLPSATPSKAHQVCSCIIVYVLVCATCVGGCGHVWVGWHDTPSSFRSNKCSSCTSPLPLPFRYSRSLLVDPTPYSWEETWPSVDWGGYQTSSKEQRYTNHLLAEVLTHHFVTTVFTVLHHTLVWVSNTYAHTHIKGHQLNLLYVLIRSGL